jgi:Domain of unknown function (DUF1816)
MDRLSINDRPAKSAKALPHYWCVEINTAFPEGHYTFGPFDSREAAGDSRSGYVEALCRGAARGVVALVKQYQPDVMRPLMGLKLPQRLAVDDAGAGPKKWF